MRYFGVSLGTLITYLIFELLLSLIIGFHVLLTLAALTNIVALGVGCQVLELANLMRQLGLLLVVILHFFLRRSQIVRHELLHLCPDIKEMLEFTITYFVESLKLLAVLRDAKLAN